MVLAADTTPGSSGRKLASNLFDSQSSTLASKEDPETSKHSTGNEKNLPEQQTIPTRSSPVGEATSFEDEEDTGSSMRAQTQQDEEKVKLHSAPLVKPSTFEEQHASSFKVQSSYPLHKHDETLSFSSTGELPKKRNEKHLEEVKTAPIATVTPLEAPPHSSLSRVESPKHSLRETVAALQQKTIVEPDSPSRETETKTESSRGISESQLTSSSSEIFLSFSGDEGVEPFPALSSSFASSELTMPYSTEWKHTPHMSPLTATLTTGGGGSRMKTLSTQGFVSSSSINTYQVGGDFMT